MAPKKIYAVRKGRKTGLFHTWPECQKQVIGFSGAEYKSFLTLEEAKEYMGIAQTNTTSIPSVNIEKNNSNTETMIAYVDGSYDVRSKEYGSGVVIFWDDEKVTFSFKGNQQELATMRNVAGEIMAAQKAMEFAIEKGAKKIIIHYDYEGIEKWCTGAWAAKKKGTQLYANAYQEMSRKVEIEFVKVRAHTGDQYNEEADILAKSAINLI